MQEWKFHKDGPILLLCIILHWYLINLPSQEPIHLDHMLKYQNLHMSYLLNNLHMCKIIDHLYKQDVNNKIQQRLLHKLDMSIMLSQKESKQITMWRMCKES